MLPHVVFAGTLREHYILLFSAAGTIGVAAGFVGAWLGSHFGARRAVKIAAESRPADMATAAQLAPILNALDAISVEVERISEAQRFTARILSEPLPAVLPRREPRSITPH